MKEAIGNIFHVDCDAICITTNGFVKSNGHAVMGKGCAKEVQRYAPDITLRLGNALTRYGNEVHVLYLKGELHPSAPAIVSFPVKPHSLVYSEPMQVVSHMRDKFKTGDRVPGWATTAQTAIIERSAYELKQYANRRNWTNVVLPRPGCGAGELKWDDIRPLLEKGLDDRFTCMTFK